MIIKNILKKIVESQLKDLESLELGIQREKLTKINLNLPHATIISGIRRCGKSTLLHQLMKENPNYFNFEDPRAVNFELQDFEKLIEIFKELNKSNLYFFDEIQNVPKWELAIRSLLDKGKKVIITGSNASLLSKELGTRLTGRHINYELFPFSYQEMLNLIKQKPNIKSFTEYLNKGGFPEYLKYKKQEILHELLKDIVIRDIVVRHKIRNSKTMRELAIYLLTNVGKEISLNKLTKTFNIKSVNTTASFISFLEESYLIFVLPKFSYSLKKQLINPKKIYSIDNGISNVNSASFSSDKGRMLENIVFQNLRRKYQKIYYFKEKHECDFIIKDKQTIAIQVCYNLNEENKEREINGLKEAMSELKLNKGLILTFNQEDKLTIEDKIISVIPIWKWLTKIPSKRTSKILVH